MNVWTDDWDETDDWSGGGAKSRRLVDRGPSLGASLYELPSGPATFPFHWHWANEKLFAIVCVSRAACSLGKRLDD